MNFLYFLAYIFKKNMTFAASADKSETKKKMVSRIIFCHLSAIKNTNKKQSYVR